MLLVYFIYVYTCASVYINMPSHPWDTVMAPYQAFQRSPCWVLLERARNLVPRGTVVRTLKPSNIHDIHIPTQICTRTYDMSLASSFWKITMLDFVGTWTLHTHGTTLKQHHVHDALEYVLPLGNSCFALGMLFIKHMYGLWIYLEHACRCNLTSSETEHMHVSKIGSGVCF